MMTLVDAVAVLTLFANADTQRNCLSLDFLPNSPNRVRRSNAGPRPRGAELRRTKKRSGLLLTSFGAEMATYELATRLESGGEEFV